MVTLPGEANQGGCGARGIAGGTVPTVPPPALCSSPGRQGRGSARGLRPNCPPIPPWHRHSPAEEAETSRLLDVTLPGSLHTPSSLQRQMKRNPCGGESLREGQGAWGERAESWGRCQRVAARRCWGVRGEGSPQSGTRVGAQHPTPLPAEGGTGSIPPAPGYHCPPGPAGGDQNVTLPQECPAQWRGRGGRLPSCHRLIAYKVPYKHIVSKISCFQCRPAGLTIPHQHAAPRCHGVVPPVHA